MVRVLAIADEEVPGYWSRLRDLEVDVVLAAGDLPWGYLADIGAALGVPAGFVPGNHDPSTADGEHPDGFVDADARVVTLGGLRIAGLGGCVRYNHGSHQYTQAEHARRARSLLAADPVDVLLTHAPPLDLGDEPDPAHHGIEVLHDVIAALRPSWHLHGHIHPYGLAKPDRQVGDTTVRNVIPWHVLEVEPREVRRSNHGQ